MKNYNVVLVQALCKPRVVLTLTVCVYAETGTEAKALALQQARTMDPTMWTEHTDACGVIVADIYGVEDVELEVEVAA